MLVTEAVLTEGQTGPGCRASVAGAGEVMTGMQRQERQVSPSAAHRLRVGASVEPAAPSDAGGRERQSSGSPEEVPRG